MGCCIVDSLVCPGDMGMPQMVLDCFGGPEPTTHPQAHQDLHNRQHFSAIFQCHLIGFTTETMLCQ